MLLLEQNDEWLVGRRYLSESSIALVLANPTAPPSDPNSKSVRAFVLQTGGMQHDPPHRAQRSLSMAEREEISRGVAAGSRADRSPPGWGEQTLRSLIKPSSVERRPRYPRCPEKAVAAQSGRVGTGRRPPEAARRRPPGPSTARGVRNPTAESTSGNRTGRPRFPARTLCPGGCPVLSS
jgi:hypothetical protein